MMYKHLVRFILLFSLIFVISACTEKKKHNFSPEYCRSYDTFMYHISSDFYKILEDNNIFLRRSNFDDVLSTVKSLKIKETAINKEIDLNGIQCFPYLNHLELEGKGIKDISPLYELERVETLSINDTKIFSLEPLNNMKKLKSLTITNTKTLQSLSGVENFKRLEYVNLENNGLIDIKPLSNLERLKEINLNNNQIIDITHLNNLPELEILRVEGNRIHFNDVEELTGFKALKELYAKSNNICQTKALGTLEKLEFLDISDNNLGNKNNDSSCDLVKPDFSFISNIPSLKTLYVQNNGLTSLETLQEVNLENVVELDFSHNLISSIEPLLLNATINNGNLKILSLNHNEIEAVDGINELNSLTTLTLNNNKIGINGESINDIFLLNKLVELDLSHNEIQEVPPLFVEETVRLPKMHTLNLSFNNISEIKDLTKHKSLKNIILNNNQITQVINSFNDMESLEKITWIKADTIDTENNLISLIENSYSNVPNLLFFVEGLLTFDFPTSNLHIVNSFNDLDQFLEVELSDYNIISIDETSFNLQEVYSVNISDNELTNINWINNLPNLDVLIANNNQIEIEPDAFEEKAVTVLELSNNKIDNVLFLNVFRDIEVVKLTNNSISLGVDTLTPYDEIEFLNNFPNLKELNLAQNNITVVNGIVNMPSLEILNLTSNPIMKINGIVDLPSLEQLFINMNNQVEYINGFSNLGLTVFNLYDLTSDNLSITNISLKDNNFKVLRLSGKVLDDFQFIKNLDYLDELELDFTNFNNLSLLSDLKNLKSLNLSYNGITNITPLGNLTNLQELFLTNNEISNIEVLKDLTKLQVIWLNYNNIKNIKLNDTTSIFDNMKDLNYLNLWGNNLISISGLNNLTKLTSLYLPESIKEYRNALNGLTNLSMYNGDSNYVFYINSLDIIINNSFNSNIFKTLEFNIYGYGNPIENSFSYVLRLSLVNTSYTNAELDFLNGFKRLEELYFYDNQMITSFINLDLSSLTKLKYISINYMPITHINNSFNDLPELEVIYINSNSSSLEIINSLNNNPKIININLVNNNLSKLENSLNNLANLQFVNLNNYLNNLYIIDSLNNNTKLTDVIFSENITLIENSFNSQGLRSIIFTYYYYPNNITITNSFNYVKELYLSNIDMRINIIDSFNAVEIILIDNSSIKNHQNQLDYSFLKDLTNLKDLTFIKELNYIPFDISQLTNLEILTLALLNLDNLEGVFVNSKLKTINLHDMTINRVYNSFNNNLSLENIYISNVNIGEISNSFNNNAKLDTVSYDNFLGGYYLDISNSFNDNSSLDSINFNYINIRKINNSFKNNNSLKTISFNIFIMLDEIIDSFNNNPNLSGYMSDISVKAIINSFNNNNLDNYISLYNIERIENSYNNNPKLTSINLSNDSLLSIINSYNNTAIQNMHILYTSMVTEISGFDNTKFIVLELIGFENLTKVNGFKNVGIKEIIIVDCRNLVDISFLNNIDKTKLEKLYLVRIPNLNLNLITDLINTFQLNYLTLIDILADIDYININVINNLSLLYIQHEYLQEEKIVLKLSKKTSTKTLTINENLYDGLKQYYRSQIDDDEIRQIILAEIEEEFRNSLDPKKYEPEEIEDLVREYMENYDEGEINQRVNNRIQQILNDKMKYFTIY